MDASILFELNIKKIHTIFNIYTEKNKVTKRINRPCWAIILKYEGETVYINQGKKYISNLENMIILPKGSTYEWQCTQPGRYYSVEFDCDLTCDTIFSFPIDQGEKILQLYKESEHKRILKQSSYKLEIFKNTYSILLLMLQSKQQKYVPSNKHQKIVPAVEYILNNYTSPIKNGDLAALTGLSTIYFRKLFTEVFGVSPITYIHKLRIKKAKEMLQSDYDSISDIAFTLGYTNIYDFSRTFKKHTGLSPTNYIKQKTLPTLLFKNEIFNFSN